MGQGCCGNKNKDSKQVIHGDMLIGDVLSMLPDSEQIMEDYGLHCTSCSVNAFEPLKLGAMSHGLSEEVVDGMIQKINDLAAAKRKAPVDGIYVSAKAAKMVQEFAAKEDKAGWGLRITAKDNDGREPAYAMDFVEEASDGDTSFEFHDTQFHLDKESLKNMMGAEVDYLAPQFGSGFKITNPQFMGGGGGCGSGGCGCGKGGCC